MGRAIRWAAGGIAIAMSLYHMWFEMDRIHEAGNDGCGIEEDPFNRKT